jgi:hypothetical protein
MTWKEGMKRIWKCRLKGHKIKRMIHNKEWCYWCSTCYPGVQIPLCVPCEEEKVAWNLEPAKALERTQATSI